MDKVTIYEIKKVTWEKDLRFIKDYSSFPSTTEEAKTATTTILSMATTPQWEHRMTTHETTWMLLVGGLELQFGLLHSGEQRMATWVADTLGGARADDNNIADGACGCVCAQCSSDGVHVLVSTSTFNCVYTLI